MTSSRRERRAFNQAHKYKEKLKKINHTTPKSKSVDKEYKSFKRGNYHVYL